MEIVHARCCGIDVHRMSLTACLITPEATGHATKEIRTFGTMTDQILSLHDWLAEAGCTHVAMESTGVYWKPVWNLLEEAFELLLVNAQHIKAVPGRKSDVKDCEWIADLLRHGLLRPSFVPALPQRELRDLTRYRSALVRDRTREINRLQKTLESCNIKLTSVVSQVTGVSAQAMLRELAAGNTDLEAIASLARGQLAKKAPQLIQALTGTIGPHQRFMVSHHLVHIDFLDEQIVQVSREIAERTDPFSRQLEILDSVPGIAQIGAEIFLAEVGWDMRRFPTAKHLASWAGLCPGSYESAGKRSSGRTRKGSPWLKTMLVEAAVAAGRTKDTPIAARYSRLAARRGRKRAAVAIAHHLLHLAYHLLTNDELYDPRLLPFDPEKTAPARGATTGSSPSTPRQYRHHSTERCLTTNREFHSSEAKRTQCRLR
ncbi:MAG: IS110 family transposase [Thermomicrobiaceae bacterium]